MYPLEAAIHTAGYFQALFYAHCERIDIAGSIRRKKHEVKDIELVCIPRKELKNDTGNLFNEAREQVSSGFTNTVNAIAKEIIKGNTSGRYMQFKATDIYCPDITVDLFMPVKEDYFRQLVIRTGSADYVRNHIAAAWLRKGWVGAGDAGLRRREDCEEYTSGEKKKWKLINPHGEKPPAWVSEVDFFRWLCVEYTPPELREFKSTLNEAQ